MTIDAWKDFLQIPVLGYADPADVLVNILAQHKKNDSKATRCKPYTNNF
jgi:hypothetical protein